MLTCSFRCDWIFSYHCAESVVCTIKIFWSSYVRKCRVVKAPNILAVKTDQSWETSLARFLILLINNICANVDHLVYQTCAFFNGPFYNRCYIRHSPTLVLSPLLCLSAILPSCPLFCFNIKDDLILCVIINWINAFREY